MRGEFADGPLNPFGSPPEAATRPTEENGKKRWQQKLSPLKIMQLSGNGRTGIAQDQRHQQAHGNADKAGDEPQASSSGEFAGDVQPAQG